jgi:uncharacterized protein YaaN involved in tellurite resistance
MTDFSKMFGAKPTIAKTPSINLNATISQPTANLPVVQPTYGLVQKPQLPANIEEIGRGSTSKINKISEQVLNKVKVGDTGGLGKGITDILSLTATVDMSKLEEGDPGLVGKITNLFKQTRVKVLAQYEDVNQQVERIANDLKKELVEMQVENKWLEQLYQENIKEIITMKDDVENLQELLQRQIAYVNSLRQVPETDMDDTQRMQHAQLINDEANIQERIERQIDRLERLIQIGMMDAPDIRSLQKNNFDTTASFNDIIDVTLPLWKRQLTMALQAARNLNRAKLGNAIADRNNDLMRKRADLMHESSIQTAQLAQRSSVADTDTLEYTQAKLIDRLGQVKQIEAQGRAQRQADAQKISANREQLRLEMKNWGTN